MAKQHNAWRVLCIYEDETVSYTIQADGYVIDDDGMLALYDCEGNNVAAFQRDCWDVLVATDALGMLSHIPNNGYRSEFTIRDAE